MGLSDGSLHISSPAQMCEISIIIPVYNTGLYLRQCLDSISEQTFRRYEVILVDDGSTDNSPAICDEYSSNDARISVIHKANGGVSSARNAGLDIAKGKYITFIDSDDWIEADYLQEMLKVADDKCELVVSGIVYSYEDGTHKYSKLDRRTFASSDAVGFHKLIESRLYYGPVNKLFVNRIIRDNRLKFREDITYGEDRIFNYAYMYYVRNIATTDYTGYHYIIHSSDSLASTKYPNMLELEYDQWKRLKELYLKKNVLTDTACNTLIDTLFWIIHDNIFANRYLPIARRYRYIASALSIPEIEDVKIIYDRLTCPSAIKRAILNRNSIALFIIILILNVCRK